MTTGDFNARAFARRVRVMLIWLRVDSFRSRKIIVGVEAIYIVILLLVVPCFTRTQEHTIKTKLCNLFFLLVSGVFV